MRAEGSEGVLNDSKCCPSNRRCKHNELEDIPNLHVMMVLRVPLLPATTCKKSTAGVGTTTP